MSEVREPRDTAPQVSLRGNYVLIAMPNVNRAAAHRAALSGTGLEVILVRDGEEARRELARHGPPSLLILDLSLPKVDGFELLRELRKQAPPEEAGAIVVSGHAPIRAAARRMADSLGISKVLPFDVERPALREAIDAALTRSRPRLPAAPAARPSTEERVPSGVGPEQFVDTAVMTAAQRFRTAITVAYVKVGHEEFVRGSFALPDVSGTLSGAHSMALLRQVASGSDPLIVPNVMSYPALDELAPEGLAMIRGLAAAPLGVPQQGISGALCIMDTKPLQIDATQLDGLEALARELGRDLVTHAEPPAIPAPMNSAASSVDIDSLERLASADPLTGLANRRGGERDITAEMSRARRQNTPLSCVLVDLDHFKQVNDTYGHQAGDYVLREIGALLRRTLRAYDILIRWGGDEFLVVLPVVEREQAFKLAERVRLAVENVRLAGIPGITASLGVASLGSDFSFDAMFAAADRQLYRAKAAGRNSVA